MRRSLLNNFQALKKKWYQKLKESGFVDIENDEYDSLKTYTLSRSDNTERYKNAAFNKPFNQRYYALCRAIQHTEKFKKMCEEGFEYGSHGSIKGKESHRKIWELYSEGIPYPQIMKRLNISYECVKYVVQKFRILVKEENAKPDDE